MFPFSLGRWSRPGDQALSNLGSTGGFAPPQQAEAESRLGILLQHQDLGARGPSVLLSGARVLTETASFTWQPRSSGDIAVVIVGANGYRADGPWTGVDLEISAAPNSVCGPRVAAARLIAQQAAGGHAESGLKRSCEMR